MIALEGAVARRGGRRVLDGLDLDVRAGIVQAVLGADGTAPADVLAVLRTTLVLAAGDAFVAGRSVRGDRDAVRTVLRPDGIRPGGARDSVLETLVRIAARDSASRRQAELRAHALLDDLRLEAVAVRRDAQCTPSERSRIALARAILLQPAVVLLDDPVAGLDDPVAGLDDQGIANVQHAIGSLAAGGATVIVATRDPRTAVRLADAVALVHAGRVIHECPASQHAAADDLRRRMDDDALDDAGRANASRVTA